MGYEFIDESRVTILAYDLSIEDIEERKAKAIEFKTFKLAQQKLIIGHNVIKNAIKQNGTCKRVYYIRNNDVERG